MHEKKIYNNLYQYKKMSNLSPKDLPINRHELKKAKATTTKTSGDFNGSFTLYIKFKNGVKMWDKTEGKEVECYGYPFYLKWQNETKEKEVFEMLQKANWLARKYTDTDPKKGIDGAILYFNLNRGGRVNIFLKEQGIELKEVQNIKLRTYNQAGNCTWTMPDNFILSLPRLIPEEVTLERLNIYHNSLVSQTRHVDKQQAQAIYEYLKYYYLSNETESHPYKATSKKDEFFNFKSKEELIEHCQKEISNGKSADILRYFYKEQILIINEKNKFLLSIGEEETTQPKPEQEIKMEIQIPQAPEPTDEELKIKLLKMKNERYSHNDIRKSLGISKEKFNEIYTSIQINLK